MDSLEAKVRTNNPTGRNRRKKKTPVIETMTNESNDVIEIVTGRHENYDEQADSRGPSVIENVTSLLPGGAGEQAEAAPSRSTCFSALPEPITEITPSEAPLRRFPFH